MQIQNQPTDIEALLLGNLFVERGVQIANETAYRSTYQRMQEQGWIQIDAGGVITITSAGEAAIDTWLEAQRPLPAVSYPSPSFLEYLLVFLTGLSLTALSVLVFHA